MRSSLSHGGRGRTNQKCKARPTRRSINDRPFSGFAEQPSLTVSPVISLARNPGAREATLVETCQRLTYNSDGPYQATGTPKSLDHKFTTEDVPAGLIPMSALGRAAGVRTPSIDALVELVRKMTGKDFAADARNLDRLGLSGMDGPQIRRVMDEGFI
jgi:hypothetical protein